LVRSGGAEVGVMVKGRGAAQHPRFWHDDVMRGREREGRKITAGSSEGMDTQKAAPS
jgi:hypothetical protein